LRPADPILENDPLGDNVDVAMKTIAAFATESDKVMVSLDKEATPWMEHKPENKYAIPIPDPILTVSPPSWRLRRPAGSGGGTAFVPCPVVREKQIQLGPKRLN